MNERIRKMILEVGFVGYGEDTGSYNISVTAFDSRIERFAELIILECAKACESVTDPGVPIHLVSLGYAHRVKEHFGVEE
jgi:hypothetical protein